MTPLRFAELFAGAGGLSMGLERAGWSCAWHAEWDDDARAVLTHHWPQVPLYGDVTTLDGRALAAAHGAIDLLTGGSPCQDISVAGKKAGMTEGSGTRSSLFYEQMRLWDETGADLCLWENVDGARSNNDGRDFGAVLRAFVGATIPVPSDGWRTAGVAAGPRGVAAWRVLDAQFLGVPQRRRRVFVLGTRTGRVDPAEVLSLAEGVRGDSPSRRSARQGVTADAAFGALGPSSVADPISASEGKTYTHEGENNFRLHNVIAFDQHNQDTTGGVVSSLRTHGQNSGAPVVMAFNVKQDGGDADTVAPTLLAMPHDTSHANGGGQLGIVSFNETGHEKWIEERVAGSLNAHEAREAHTLITTDVDAGGFVAGTLTSSDGGADVDRAVGNQIIPTSGIPRRLTPLECERLMSWPDRHTLVPGLNGRLLKDSPRYKLCGNGVASVHTHWIGWRLASALGGAA